MMKIVKIHFFIKVQIDFSRIYSIFEKNVSNKNKNMLLVSWNDLKNIQGQKRTQKFSSESQKLLSDPWPILS